MTTKTQIPRPNIVDPELELNLRLLAAKRSAARKLTREVDDMKGEIGDEVARYLEDYPEGTKLLVGGVKTGFTTRTNRRLSKEKLLANGVDPEILEASFEESTSQSLEAKIV